MALTPSLRRQLQEERSRLIAEVTAIDVLLRTAGGESASKSVGEVASTLNADGGESLSDLGFRDAMRTVMRTSKTTWMAPAEVTRLLRAGGYEHPGKTSLQVRVSSELWAMANKQLMRKKGKKYALRPEEAK